MIARPPSPIEGSVLYVGAAYLLGRDVACMGFVYHLLPVLAVGTVLTVYCIWRAAWCLCKQVARS